jgi:predicted nicotinamide N-methyase
VVKSFFDDYPEFYETGYQPTRLGARHEVIIQAHKKFISGSTVLDLGSHDGRWAFAALKAGAKKVISIEARQDLVDAQHRIFKNRGIESSQYAAMTGNGLDLMNTSKVDCDVVMLLGIFYHIHNHIHWVEAIRRTGAQYVIIDTGLTASADQSDQIVRFKVEDTSLKTSSPFETISGNRWAVGGHPSRGFVTFAFRVFGYSTNEIQWHPYLEKWGTAGLEDYAQDRRGTFFARRVK